ncbi:MAG: glutamine-hydrolyzing GMP synthase [Clostridiales Family XIII bacterium]|jgi:GMP synthase (glutamine-hydrolysing)|nr:glutamine-hydrolyzing GMP synthase [Clostridiales Family XIII bacterium]
MGVFTGIWVVDFGGQYNQLIARRVREANVYCEIVPWFKCMDRVAAERPEGIIFTGGPASVYEHGAPKLPAEIFNMGIPMLGICYGAQLMAHTLGGKVASPDYKEYGRVRLFQTPSGAGAAAGGGPAAGETAAKAATGAATSGSAGVATGAAASGSAGVATGAGASGSAGAATGTGAAASALFKGIPQEETCWMSHTDYVETMPDGFRVTSRTENCPAASLENAQKKLYGVQFHPEVHHTPFGQALLRNFLYDVCGCAGDWTMANFAKSKIEEIKEKAAGKKVLCALSGGVDSSVAAVLVHEAIGDSLTCIFVDHGLLRKDEGDQVMEVYGRQFNMKIKRVNAQEQFLSKLEGVEDPEMKRKIIGREFIRVFEAESRKLYEEEGGIDYLLQGTIYPDVVESGSGEAAVIKSHHNVGGLPDDMKLELIEPLRSLFKDEVRKVGEELGIAYELVWRQPFPGPGLAIRCLGEVTPEKLHIIRESDAILREEIRNAGLEREIWQYFTVLPNIRSVGVMGDFRTYDHMVGIRAVTSVDGMTSDWARIPYDVLETISARIVNEVPGVNRVAYDITSKPPSTIEWE